MSRDPVPKYGSWSEIYPADATQQDRCEALTAGFEATYGCKPQWTARAPGRVNVLGEHIDYSLLPVIPAAIQQDILIAVSTSIASEATTSFEIANTSSHHPTLAFALQLTGEGFQVDPPLAAGDPAAYFKAAVLECYSSVGAGGLTPRKMQWLIDGNVPEGAGLSSSAAIMVSSVIAILLGDGLLEKVTQGDVVGLALAAEHRLGLRNGGMDQAASVFSKPGRLLHLSFHPELSSTPLPLPDSLSLVIANSMSPHSLTGSASSTYNLRVVENLCGTRLLLHHWESKGDIAAQPTGKAGRAWLKEALLRHAVGQTRTEKEIYERMLVDVEEVLGESGRGEAGWTAEEMSEASGMDPAAFEETFLRFIPVTASHFHLYKRVKHTIEESLRVIAFKEICDELAQGEVCPNDRRLLALGQLITDSHASLRDQYHATVPMVDQLQEICLASGALGSRQTGGGWGGAVISLVPKEQVSTFLAALAARYPPYADLDEGARDKVLFATSPGCGAGYVDI